jgi:hypothetical protein
VPLGGSGAITESLLILTGSMGAGKTTVLAEASDLLSQRRIVHAAIDLDALGLGYLPSAASNDSLMYLNLQSVSNNYASQGVKRLLLARAIEDLTELELCRGAVSARNIVVCRLTANIETMKQRVKMRELGTMQQELVARVSKVDDILDRAQIEDFTIINENRGPAEVAHEMLVKAGWISD